MISVLIPTYNWDITSLVAELHQQLKITNIPFEIISIDDASSSKLNLKNKEINQLENCTFFSLEDNIGRSAIRNLLVDEAKYNWLLFLDADVFPKRKNFIKTYLESISKTNFDVFVGGIAYKNGVNDDKLRWKTGKRGEEKSAKKRNQLPYHNLLTGNFLIKKDVFSYIRFEEKIKKYGYEDLLFAKELNSFNTRINHINNEVYHLGIDDNYSFLIKTKEALQNLRDMLLYGKLFFKDTKISKTYKSTSVIGIPKFLCFFITTLEKNAINKSSIFFYNLFRLAYMHKVFREKN